MQKIPFFYDELHMSADLIEYLVEYCVSRGRKSMRYIETVALAWAKTASPPSRWPGMPAPVFPRIITRS